MEKTDFSKYTVKGLQMMAKDAGVKKMSKATANTIIEALADIDLSELDLDSYPIKKEKEAKAKPESKPSAVKGLTPRRSANGRNWGRR